RGASRTGSSRSRPRAPLTRSGDGRRCRSGAPSERSRRYRPAPHRSAGPWRTAVRRPAPPPPPTPPTGQMPSQTRPCWGNAIYECLESQTNWASGLSQSRHRPLLMRLVTALLVLAGIAQAQPQRERWLDNCRDSWSTYGRFCEVRTSTIPVTKALRVDGRDNGGIAVHAWDKNEISLVARVSANGDDDAEARDIAKEITVRTDGGEIRADGPRTTGR